ncbi:3-dehydroquinate synthase [Cytobacillus sp. Hz8]|uniref:3-dehydroquinate synthase n=1 Tax=Cytobacillus sp. Hz8 TaxID=3347168 RepID=UPI0035E11975
MKTITIRTQSKQYPTMIGHGASELLAPFLKDNFPSLTKLFIITDEHIHQLHFESFIEQLQDFQSIVSYVVPNGEKAKTFEVYYQLLTFALEQKLDRKSMILSLGGGAVGDVSGFVAGTFMRGIPFVQIPTTILAHDSAVGGKVAINHPLGKNLIGVFHQPEAVIYDLNFLGTLPQKEKRSGFAEVFKEALIADGQFYQWLLTHIDSLDSLSSDHLAYFLEQGMRIKGSIVAEDEKETGVRAFLNLGHTLGHAIEAELGYGQITHGEAVAIGTIFALRLSSELLDLDFNHQQLEDWLRKLGYRIDLPKQLDNNKLLNRMKLDKKSVGQNVHFVLLEKIGVPKMVEVQDVLLLQKLEEFKVKGEKMND